MEIISVAVAVVVLGILYKRMIAREVPEQIGTLQAVVPAALGMVSTALSFPLMLLSAVLLVSAGFVADGNSLWMRSIVSALIVAGLPEELSKFLMLLISILIFRSRLRNVYEYVLLGVGVGLGFTIFEEYLYSDSEPAALIFRLFLIALHLIFSMIMAYHFGMARYQRQTRTGSPFWSCILAFLVPIVMHTLYDACTGMNKYLLAEDDDTVMIGIIIGIAGTIVMFIAQVILLRKVRKNAGALSAMTFDRKADRTPEAKPEPGTDAVSDTMSGAAPAAASEAAPAAGPGAGPEAGSESAPDIAPEN